MSGNAWGESWGITDSFAWGDSWGFEGFVPPVVVVTPPGSGGVGVFDPHTYPEFRKKPKKKPLPKKKELLEELDDYLVELKARIAEVPEPQPASTKLVARVDLALSAELTNKQIRSYLNQIQDAIEEMDDEETIILALH